MNPQNTSSHPLQVNLSSASSAEVPSAKDNPRPPSPPVVGHSQVNKSTARVSCSSEGKREGLLVGETTRRRGSNNKLPDVPEIMHQQDLGMQILALVIPMAVALVVFTSELVQTIQMQLVVIALSFATAFAFNGLLLRKTCIEAATVCLMFAAALMMFSFFTLLSLFLPLYLIWIPIVSWLACLIPLALYGWARFRRAKTKDPEKGELVIISKPICPSDHL